MSGLTDRVKAAALEEGLDLVGVTTAEPVADGEHLERWLAASCHGGMAYLARAPAARKAPRSLLPSARSVVCAALAYELRGPAREPRRGPAVAAYAARPDYHTALRRRLDRLGRRLETWAPGAEWRTAVDSSGLMEKPLAARAGLGFVGRNTLLVSPARGSALLLGELLTSVELEPDAPMSSRCGGCTACVDACPTGALEAPGWLNARRCIAYLTIEHRGPFDVSLLGCLEGHLFGCDLCQLACPFNRDGAAPPPSGLAPRPALRGLTVERAAELGAEAWHQLTAGTPLRRLDLARWRRNLQAALGRTGAPEATGT